MPTLSRDVLKVRILSEGVIRGYADLDGQLTANGFDVRLAGIVEITHAGRLAVKKQDCRPPRLGRAFVLEGYQDRLEGYDIKEVAVLKEGTVVRLDPLKCYFAVTCEAVDQPIDLAATIHPRTSLFRLSQAMLQLAASEAGYKGFFTFKLFSPYSTEIELGARFAQLLFHKLEGTGDYAKQKESSYSGGKLF